MWFQKMDSKVISKAGFKQASSVFGYIVAFALFISNASKVFPKEDNQFLAPIMFLSMFSFSVLACGLMVFYKPYMLFVDKKGKEAIELILATTKWLGVYVIGIMIVVLLWAR